MKNKKTYNPSEEEIKKLREQQLKRIIRYDCFNRFPHLIPKLNKTGKVKPELDKKL